MALPTLTLARIKYIAQQDEYIQGLLDADPQVVMILEDVERMVKESIFGEETELARRYLAAHFLASSNQEDGGRGSLSSESIGGISRGYTMPTMTQKSALSTTGFGLHYLEIANRHVIPLVVGVPGELA